MSAPVSTARIGDGGQEGEEITGGVGFHGVPPCGEFSGCKVSNGMIFSYPPRLKQSIALDGRPLIAGRETQQRRRREIAWLAPGGHRSRPDGSVARVQPGPPAAQHPAVVVVPFGA